MRDQFEIRYLSSQFYREHPHWKFPELLVKKKRPYICWEMPNNQGFYLCIPFRSNLHNKDSFYFLRSKMDSDKHPHPGLDFRKPVIIRANSFSDEKPVIDSGCYRDVRKYASLIRKKAFRFINRYVDYCTCARPMSIRAMQQQIMFSTLPYFHKELNLSRTHLIKTKRGFVPIYFDSASHKVKSGFFQNDNIAIPLSVMEFKKKIGCKFPAIEQNTAIRHKIAAAMNSPDFTIEISQNTCSKKKEGSR